MKKTSNIFKKVLQSSLLLAPSGCYCIIVSFMFHVLGPNDHSQHSMQISHRRQGLPLLHLDAAAECTQRKSMPGKVLHVTYQHEEAISSMEWRKTRSSAQVQ